MEIFIKFYILYGRSVNQTGQKSFTVKEMCSLSSGFIQIRSISRIRTLDRVIFLPHSSSSGFSIHWLPERFGIYIITDHFLKLVRVLPKENTAADAWDLQVGSLSRSLNLKGNVILLESKWRRRIFYRLSFYSLHCSYVMFFYLSSFHCFYSVRVDFMQFLPFLFLLFLVVCVDSCGHLVFLVLTFPESELLSVWCLFCFIGFRSFLLSPSVCQSKLLHLYCQFYNIQILTCF